MRKQRKHTHPNLVTPRVYIREPTISGANLYSAMQRREGVAAKKGKILPSRVPRIRSTAMPPSAEEVATRKDAHLNRQKYRAPETPGLLERFFNALANVGKRKPRQ